MNDRKMITDAMDLIMYDTGSSIEGSTWRNPCVYFRPRTSSDASYFTIQYGTGCNAHVRVINQFFFYYSI